MKIEDYKVENFLEYFPEFTDNLTKEIQLKQFELHKKMAFKYLDQYFLEDEFEYCVGLYIAHNLQLFLLRYKNINNSINMNSQNLESYMQNNQGAGAEHNLSTTITTEKNYARTEYGRLLYPKIKASNRYRFLGVY